MVAGSVPNGNSASQDLALKRPQGPAKANHQRMGAKTATSAIIGPLRPITSPHSKSPTILDEKVPRCAVKRRQRHCPKLGMGAELEACGQGAQDSQIGVGMG